MATTRMIRMDEGIAKLTVEVQAGRVKFETECGPLVMSFNMDACEAAKLAEAIREEIVKAMGPGPGRDG